MITKVLLSFILLLAACEPFYDPVRKGDVAACPSSGWHKLPLEVKETQDNRYTAEDLSGTMPLPRLLDIALSNNPSTRASWDAARAAAYGFHGSLSAYYPTVTYSGSLDAQTNKGSAFATTTAGIISGTGTTGAFYSTFAANTLSLQYLLLDFGGRDATAEFALQALYAANWEHDYTMQQVIYTLLSAYTSWIGNKGLVAAYEQNLKDAEVALDSAKAMRAAGLATLNDVLAAQSTLEMTRTSLVQAQGAEKTSLAEVLVAAGLPADTPITPEQLPQELPVVEVDGNISSLLELPKKRRPDLGAAIAAVKQQEAQLAIAYSSSMPTLTANAIWSQVRFIDPPKAPGYNEVAGLLVNFPIFQGFYYMNQQRQLRAEIEEALANLDVQVAAVEVEVATNYYSFLAAKAALPSSEAAVVASGRAFRGYRVQYRTGTASILDVLNALTALSTARAQQVVTRTQWASSLVSLAFSVGVLCEKNGAWKEAPPPDLYKLPIKDDNA
jgi:outer membrane protein TolC